MKNHYLNKKLLSGIIILLFAVLMSFLIIDGYLNLNRDIKIYSADVVDSIDQRMSSILSEVNVFPQYIGNDLLFLSKLSSLERVINSKRDNTLKDLENDFLEFLKESSAYYQLGYIDEEGNEIVKVEFDSNYKIIPRENLQNKKEEDYFTKTIRLDEGEVFISNLYVNKDEEETRNNPINIPLILSATSIFNENNESNGIVFLSVYANYFLDNIRNAQREGENVYLIDKGGNYLAHPDREKEFAFLFEGNDNFYSDYPEIPKEIVLDSVERRFENDNLIFSFRRIYPTAGDFAIYKGSEKIFGKEAKDYYLWVIVSVSDKKELDKTISELKQEYLYFLLFSGIIALIILILIFTAIFRGLNSMNVGKRRK